jgi:hypothetical protein
VPGDEPDPVAAIDAPEPAEVPEPSTELAEAADVAETESEAEDANTR